MNQLFNLLLPWPWRDFNPITDVFVYIIFLVAVVCVIIFVVKTVRRVRLMGTLIQGVNEYKRPAKPDMLPQLAEKFDSNKEIREMWREFSD